MTILFGLAAVLAVVGISGFKIYEYMSQEPLTVEGRKIESGEILHSTKRLIGSADSQEAAEEMAELYQITLIEYMDGKALFETQEDPLEVIARGEKEGYPQVWMDNIYMAD